MTNSRASKGYQLLDKHLATGTEATYTFTKTLDMKTQYREILVIISGKSTAALALDMKLNAQTDYDYVSQATDTASVSGAVTAAAATSALIHIGVLDGANSFYARATIVCNDADDTLMMFSEGTAPHEGIVYHGSHPQSGSTTTITTIEILTSTSTWIAGTEISTYGLSR